MMSNSEREIETETEKGGGRVIKDRSIQSKVLIIHHQHSILSSQVPNSQVQVRLDVRFPSIHTPYSIQILT